MIFENCVRRGVFPDKWKMSNVCPVHKKDEKNLNENYRPISLLPILGKVFEKVLFDTLYEYIMQHKFLTPCQSGFIKGDSCVNQLLSIIHEIHKNLDANPSIDTIGVFLDMSKAFDKVWHKGLIMKLKSYGIQSNFLHLLENYLYNRKQRVTLNGITSSWKPVKSGVPQGSILGPILFLIFINDLPDDIICNPKLFADDVSLNAVMNEKNTSTNNIKVDLKALHAWSVKWKMVFNPDVKKPAEQVIFSNRNSTSYDTLSYSGIDLKPVASHKHLGFILDSKLDYTEHIDAKIAKANQGIGIIRRLFHYLPRKALLQIYNSHIRSHLDYCDILYHKPMYDDFNSSYYSERSRNDPTNTNYHFTNKIEKVQYNAALAITGCIRGTSREKLYSELGLTSLYDRRRCHRLHLFYKIKNNLTPSYLRQFVVESSQRLHNTRMIRQEVMSTRTLKFMYSFFPDVTKSWSNLSNLIKNAPSIEVFKKRLMEFFKVSPSLIFDVKNSDGLKYLTRLRVGLSHLHEHKFNHNFEDTPSPFCSCGTKQTENTEHFLLHCPSYLQIRRELFGKLREIVSFPTLISSSYTCILLLYGNNRYQPEVNKKILDLTISYILSSDRFSGPLISC